MNFKKYVCHFYRKTTVLVNTLKNPTQTNYAILVLLPKCPFCFQSSDLFLDGNACMLVTKAVSTLKKNTKLDKTLLKNAKTYVTFPVLAVLLAFERLLFGIKLCLCYFSLYYSLGNPRYKILCDRYLWETFDTLLCFQYRLLASTVLIFSCCTLLDG